MDTGCTQGIAYTMPVDGAVPSGGNKPRTQFCLYSTEGSTTTVFSCFFSIFAQASATAGRMGSPSFEDTQFQIESLVKNTVCISRMKGRVVSAVVCSVGL